MMQTDELVAGRELDALVAVQIVGYPAREVANGFRAVLPYSTNCEAALTLLDAVITEGYWPEMDLRRAGWFVTLYRADMDGDFLMRLEPEPPQAWADTLPLAICRAALAAKEER